MAREFPQQRGGVCELPYVIGLAQAATAGCGRFGEDVGVVKCGLYATVCVGKTSYIVGVTSVGEKSVLR